MMWGIFKKKWKPIEQMSDKELHQYKNAHPEMTEEERRQVSARETAIGHEKVRKAAGRAKGKYDL
ncbi:MAG: hypothetical protein ABL883_00785 [Terricaulis sp.]